MFVKYNGDFIPAVITGIPLPADVAAAQSENRAPTYSVLTENDCHLELPASDIRHENDPIGLDDSPEYSSDTLLRTLPPFFRLDQKVTLELDGVYRRGFLNINTNHEWVFELREKNGAIVDTVPIPDLPYTWSQRLDENTFGVGWQCLNSFLASTNFVSASTCTQECPTHLWRALDPNFSDRDVWQQSYDEEFDSLVDEGTFKVITKAQYTLILRRTKKPALPTMCVLLFKLEGTTLRPHRAKSRIVVLGNLETTVWAKSDVYAPVVSQSVVRLLASEAVGKHRVLKQADFKNAFVQAKLPDNELVVVKPPRGCPHSAPNTFWKLIKTLYGLRRSPRHWYDTLKKCFALINMYPLPNQPSAFVGCPLPDAPPLYVGCYVDDVVYFSESDQVEQWFEAGLSSHLRVEFMGPVSYYCTSVSTFDGSWTKMMSWQ